jgi:hypothetical protein
VHRVSDRHCRQIELLAAESLAGMLAVSDSARRLLETRQMHETEQARNKNRTGATGVCCRRRASPPLRRLRWQPP